MATYDEASQRTATCDEASQSTWRQREAVSLVEAADILGIARSFAYEAARRGELGAFRLGSKWLVPTAELRRLLDGGRPPAA